MWYHTKLSLHLPCFSRVNIVRYDWSNITAMCILALARTFYLNHCFSTFLDASAVPNGISGRWTFLVMSISSMLVHAYYTSAIISALMSSGQSGPDSLRTLADSRYAIASEDYDYMRYLFFDVRYFDQLWDSDKCSVFPNINETWIFIISHHHRQPVEIHCWI